MLVTLLKDFLSIQYFISFLSCYTFSWLSVRAQLTKSPVCGITPSVEPSCGKHFKWKMFHQLYKLLSSPALQTAPSPLNKLSELNESWCWSLWGGFRSGLFSSSLDTSPCICVLYEVICFPWSYANKGLVCKGGKNVFCVIFGRWGRVIFLNKIKYSPGTLMIIAHYMHYLLTKE